MARDRVTLDAVPFESQTRSKVNDVIDRTLPGRLAGTKNDPNPRRFVVMREADWRTLVGAALLGVRED